MDMAFAVSWRNSAAFQLDITPPSGLAHTAASATAPVFDEITSAPIGTYSYGVTPTVAVSSQPYVVMAARRIAAFNQVDDVKAYPNPFRADQHTVVVLEGLTAQATIKIYTMSGHLVKTINK